MDSRVTAAAKLGQGALATHKQLAHQLADIVVSQGWHKIRPMLSQEEFIRAANPRYYEERLVNQSTFIKLVMAAYRNHPARPAEMGSTLWAQLLGVPVNTNSADRAIRKLRANGELPPSPRASSVRQAIQVRRERVQKMLERGTAPADIAAALGVQPKTVERDVKALGLNRAHPCPSCTCSRA